MDKMILGYLMNAAEAHNVNILYAAESGSRAWGFASPNSDYDVRFIYARPVAHYLSFNVELKRDVLELKPDNPLWDISGWDIRKTLGLFTRSNGTLLEWLRSPLHYIVPHASIATLQSLAKDHFNPTALCYHYYRMGKNNVREFLHGDRVSLKKYLYVLRGFIAVDFIRETQALPAVDFRTLLEDTAAFNAEVQRIKSEVESLIDRKQQTGELGTGSRIAVLDTYIADALDINENAFVHFKRDDLRHRGWDDRLNGIFREAVGWISTSSDSKRF